MESTPIEEGYVKFAIVVDGEVAGTIQYPTTTGSETVTRVVAALQSDPKIVEIFNHDIRVGWAHSGTEFTPPVEGA
jgi:hypothetical protein